MAPWWPTDCPSLHRCSDTGLPVASFAMNLGEVYSPSACPVTHGSNPSPWARKTENFRLEEPAFRTRMASAMASPHRTPGAGPARVGDEAGHGARRQPGNERVRPAGEDDRHLRPEHDAGGIRPR